MILAASAGCRIGELLGLEIKDLLDDFTTVRIIQQAKGKRLTKPRRRGTLSVTMSGTYIFNDIGAHERHPDFRVYVERVLCPP
jgi:integrase